MQKRYLAIVATLCMLTGCGPRTTEFLITDRDIQGATTQFFEPFDECYFAEDAAGNLDIVARRRAVIGPPGDDQPITQIVHIRRFWNTMPGKTYAESSMINATVNYVIVDDRNAATFEGGGFVTFRRNREDSQIRGKLESSSLSPLRKVGNRPDLFAHAEVTGTFAAHRDKKEVVRLLNEVEHLVGPSPRYIPPPDPALR